MRVFGIQVNLEIAADHSLKIACFAILTGCEKSIGPPYGFNSTNVTYFIFSRRFFAIFFVLPKNKPF